MKRGFTLIELLIVIGVLAILSTTVTIILNPAELLRQSRDVQRINDLRSLTDAMNYYLVRSSTPPSLDVQNVSAAPEFFCDSVSDFAQEGDGSSWYASNGSGSLVNTMQPFQYPMTALFVPVNGIVPNSAVIREINGAGWVPTPFNQTIGGNIISKLPVDPSPDTTPSQGLVGGGRFYAFRCEGLRYEINANMESSKYSNGGEKDVETLDGGRIACRNASNIVASRCTSNFANLIYEVGNDPELDL